MHKRESWSDEGDHQRGQGHLDAHHHLHLAGRIQRGRAWQQRSGGEAISVDVNYMF